MSQCKVRILYEASKLIEDEFNLFKHPDRVLVVGPSGTGISNLADNIILDHFFSKRIIN